jgi:uncharacterized repeat protein (TIGR02543 family)
MRAKRRPIQANLSRLLVALLVVVGFQATGFTQTSPALASATEITDDGSNSSGWTGEVSLDGSGGNLGSAFTFSKNTLMGKEFGTSGDDFSGATIEFQVKFVDGKDHIALFWGDGVNQTPSITNSLYLGPAGNPASGSDLAGKIGISGGHVSPHIYWHGIDGGVSGTGSASVTSGLWQVNRWYVIKVAIGASSTTYYVDGVLIQTKATSLPTANVITLGGDDRNGWGFSNGVFVDNISITPGGAAPAGSTGSLYLNNTSLSHVFNSNLDIGTGQFTMEMWVKPVGNKGQPLWGSNLTGTYNIGADTGLPSSCRANTRLLIARQAQACPYDTPVGSFSTETTWRHVVWQRGASNAMAVYINGVRHLAITESADFGLKTGPLKIGWSERAAFTGYITNVRLVKGAGLYSGSTITPPTEPLTRNVSAGTTTFLLGTTSSSTALRDSVSNFIMTADGTSNFDCTVAATPLGGLTWSSETPFAPPLAVNYDLNLGSGSAPTASVQPGASFTTAAAPTRSGYTFTVWRSGASDTPASTSFTANRSYTMGSTDITLTAQWSPLSNTVTFDSQNWQTAATIQTLTGSSSTLPTAPTWYGYNFKGWSETSTGAVVDVSTVTIAGAKTFYAIWEQKSLAGLTGLPSPDVINPHATQARTITSELGDTSTAVKVPGGALPTTFQVKVYTLPDDSFADEKLGAGTYIISQVVAWADTATGTLGNIQDTAAGKPIEMTITSPDIKAGAKVYSVLGDSSTLLATATQNGSVTVTFSEDPVIIVEAAPAVNSAPGGSSPDPVVIKPVVKPTKPVANTPKGINFAGFNPNSWVLTKAIKASIDRFFKKVASPTKVSCVGNTMGPKILKNYQHIAERRGEVVCDYIVNNFAETAEIVISGVPTKFADTRYRRTRVGLSY